jgi:hypothetical protein
LKVIMPAGTNFIISPAARTHARAGRPSLCLLLLSLLVTGRIYGQTEVIIDFEKAEVTGRWIESWKDKGVVFTPAHPPTKSKAKARLMFFSHLPSGRKGILSAMADDPIPVRARFPNGSSSVTVTCWGSTGCAARLEAYGSDDKLLDKAVLDVIPGRKSPADPIPAFKLTAKGTNIAYIEFSGPRAGEFLAAEELRFVPIPTATKERHADGVTQQLKDGANGRD